MKVSAGTGCTVIVTGAVVVLGGVMESVAVTLTVLLPAVVDVPVIVQFAPRLRPAGKVPPASEQMYGPVPPLTPMVPVYGAPTVAVGGGARVRVEPPGLTVSVTGCVWVRVGVLESVA